MVRMQQLIQNSDDDDDDESNENEGIVDDFQQQVQLGNTNKHQPQEEDDDLNERKVSAVVAVQQRTTAKSRTTSSAAGESVNDNDGLSYKERRKLNNPTRKRHGARNQHKIKHFVRWLVETFPEQMLGEQQGKGGGDGQGEPVVSSSSLPPNPILDVAGGKGELAARLCACHHRNVIMVDPRPLSNPATVFESTVLKTIPNKWQLRYQQRKLENPNFLNELFQKHFLSYEMYFDETTVETSNDLQNAIQSACLLIGMHADSATEAIVDAAIKYNKPFVVVPCCVFPNLFPNRIVRRRTIGNEKKNNETGEEETIEIEVPVRSYEDFCMYLVNKDPRFRTSILPFEGRNVAIWWDGGLVLRVDENEAAKPTATTSDE